jgi:hypothetical protein
MAQVWWSTEGHGCGIDDHLRVEEDETVLIFGAAGAVGTLAAQFAKRRHAQVLGVVRGRDAADLVLELGADAAIDGASGDAAGQVGALAPPKRTLGHSPSWDARWRRPSWRYPLQQSIPWSERRKRTRGWSMDMCWDESC